MLLHKLQLSLLVLSTAVFVGLNRWFISTIIHQSTALCSRPAVQMICRRLQEVHVKAELSADWCMIQAVTFWAEDVLRFEASGASRRVWITHQQNQYGHMPPPTQQTVFCPCLSVNTHAPLYRGVISCKSSVRIWDGPSAVCRDLTLGCNLTPLPPSISEICSQSTYCTGAWWDLYSAAHTGAERIVSGDASQDFLMVLPDAKLHLHKQSAL